MRKLISWIFVGALLVIVPFGSWYYLKQGLDYRKNALVELKTKAALPALPDSLDFYRGKTTLFVFDYIKASEILPPVMEQFNDVYTFQVAGSNLIGNYIQTPSYLLDSIRRDGMVFAIVDTTGSIRNYYTADKNQVKKMVEHLAIILPRPKDKDIKMK